jgi:hypothetical protein
MLNINGLCSVVWTNYILDLAVIGALIFVMWYCGKKGLINCFFGLVSVASAILIAVLFTKVFVSATGGLFGLEATLKGSFESAFLKVEGFSTDISNTGLATALEQKNLPTFLVDLVIEKFGNENIPENTTLAMVTSSTLSGVCINFIAWGGLAGITWGLMWILKKILRKIARKIKIIGKIDTVLGCVVGLFFCLSALYFTLGVLSLIPSEGITSYMNDSILVGSMYNNNVLTKLLGAMIA